MVRTGKHADQYEQARQQQGQQGFGGGGFGGRGFGGGEYTYSSGDEGNFFRFF